MVNAKNGGDVSLEQVVSQLRKSAIVTSGSIAGQPGAQGKTATLDFYSKNGRIQDLLLLFIKDEHSPMSGITSWRAHVVFPPGKEAFLKKVRLVGDFGIDAGAFSNPQTQQDTNKLSAESRDENDQNPATVLSSLQGHVEVKNGTAIFNNLGFGIPGAFAQMNGTYDLISETIDPTFPF